TALVPGAVAGAEEDPDMSVGPVCPGGQRDRHVHAARSWTGAAGLGARHSDRERPDDRAQGGQPTSHARDFVGAGSHACGSPRARAPAITSMSTGCPSTITPRVAVEYGYAVPEVPESAVAREVAQALASPAPVPTSM